MTADFSPEEFEREIRRRIEQVMRELSREVSGLIDSVLKATEPVISRIREGMNYLMPEYETYLEGSEVIVVIQIPGASKSSIDVMVRERDLRVEAGFSEELKERASRARLFKSKGYRFFLELPREVDPSGAKATYMDGVLILKLPAQKPKGVKIEIE